MNDRVKQVIAEVKLAESQVFGCVTVFPIMVSCGADLEYITLSEALAGQFVTITEITESGSVPELRVKNSAAVPVLIVDGEELRGGKQNRVANTTMLVREKSTTTIPVSCTEHGRWHYDSPRFRDSEVILAHKARAGKSRGVSGTLAGARSYRGNQGMVWSDIDELHEELGSWSPSGAMRDAYESVRAPLETWVSAFPLQPRQNGLLVCLDGKPVGMDIVSRTDAYARLHERFLKSYLVGCVGRSTKESVPTPIERAREFLDGLSDLQESVFPSPGYGEDFRYTDTTRCGSALVYAGACLHAAFFAEPSVGAIHRDAEDAHPRTRNPRRRFIA